ncbi:MAG: hypothetical protein ACI4XQ_05490 [Eubacteriales bacterium]
MMYRVKCKNCGTVMDVAGDSVCLKCRTPLASKSDGMIQVYRMGSPIGVAAGFGIYINGAPYGHIGNKQSLCIPVSFGSYTLHCTCGVTRRCSDLVINVTPEFPNAYAKIHIRPGFWTNYIVVEPSAPEDMPR